MTGIKVKHSYQFFSQLEWIKSHIRTAMQWLSSLWKKDITIAFYQHKDKICKHEAPLSFAPRYHKGVAVVYHCYCRASRIWKSFVFMVVHHAVKPSLDLGTMVLFLSLLVARCRHIYQNTACLPVSVARRNCCSSLSLSLCCCCDSFVDRCCCCLLLIKFKALSMVVALERISSFVMWVSLNKASAYILSLLSCESCSISYACLRIVSSAVRHIWYCSGKYSVVYSLMDLLACSRRYCTSSTMQVLATWSSRAISEWFRPLDFNWMTFSRRHSNCSALLVTVRFLPHEYYECRIFSFIAIKSG